MTTAAVPTEDGTGYRITGTKLWATNGAIADVVVVMAVVPEREGHRGGITAFICPADAEGVTVEARNAFMGLRGIENSVTRFEDVLVPAENVIGGEGKGLKIALATLNTGRLSLPAICAATTKHALKIAREWAAERRQWGRPIGEHDPVAQHLAFIAGTAFGLEAVVDVSSRLADDQRNDVRIEAALAKLYASELGWRAVDAMIQVRGGRGYETAASLAARGEKPVPAEQLLRDMRINRIFEGSTEIMHLLIAREAVDQHLQAAGGVLDPQAAVADKLRRRRQGGRASTPPGSRSSRSARASSRARSRSSARSRRTSATSSARRASSPARPSTSWAATRRASSTRATCSGGSSTSAPSSTPSRARASTPRPSPASTPSGREGAAELAGALLPAGPAPRRRAVPRAVGQRRRRPARGRAGRSWAAATRGSRRTCSTRPATARCSPRTRPRPPSARPRPRPPRRGAGRGGAVAGRRRPRPPICPRVRRMDRTGTGRAR